MSAVVPFTATLHLEVRSRGPRPGTSHIERRVYQMTYEVTPTNDLPCRLHMIHDYPQGDYITRSVHTWDPTEYDLTARTATFRETLKASDKLLAKLERHGWQRRPDLEAQG